MNSLKQNVVQKDLGQPDDRKFMTKKINVFEYCHILVVIVSRQLEITDVGVVIGLIKTHVN